MRSRRLPLGLGVEPNLSLRIQEGIRAGVYTYRYTIRNGPGALRGISQVVFDMPTMAGIESVVTPRGWGFWPKEYIERIKSRMVRRKIDWFAKPDTIEPKGALRGMEIVSVNRPGLITAYFRGTYIATVYDDTPDVVGPLVASLHQVENNSVSLPIVAPKFPPAVAKTAIAQDFLDQIRALIAENELSAASAYIGELRAVLEACVKGEDLPATERFRSLSRRPGNELERQIDLAVNLSLAAGVPGSADTVVPEGRTR